MIVVLLLMGCGPEISYEEEIAPIVSTRCVGCHNSELTEGQLDLTPDPLAALVDQPSRQSDLMLVEPGDALYSYVFHKVNGSQSLAEGAGTQMPLGSTLSGDEIDLLAAWIDEGARP